MLSATIHHSMCISVNQFSVLRPWRPSARVGVKGYLDQSKPWSQWRPRLVGMPSHYSFARSMLLPLFLLLLCCSPSHASKRPRSDSSGSGARETIKGLWQDLSSTTADPENQRALIEVLLMAGSWGAEGTVRLLDQAVEQDGQPPLPPFSQPPHPLQPVGPSSGPPAKVGLNAEVVEIFTRAVLIFTFLVRPSITGRKSFGELPELMDTALAFLDSMKQEKDGTMRIVHSGSLVVVGGFDSNGKELAERLGKLRSVLQDKMGREGMQSPIVFNNASNEELLLFVARYLLTSIQMSSLWDAATVRATEGALDTWTGLLKTKPDLLNQRAEQIIDQLCRNGVPLPGNWLPLSHQNFDEFFWLIVVTRRSLSSRNRHRGHTLPPFRTWPFLGEKAMRLAEQCGLRTLLAHMTFLLFCGHRPFTGLFLDLDEAFFWLHSDLIELTTIANRPPVPRSPVPTGSLAEAASSEIEGDLKCVCQLAFLLGAGPELREGQSTVDLATRILSELSAAILPNRADQPTLDGSRVLLVDDLRKQLCWLTTNDPLSGNRHREHFCNVDMNSTDMTCSAAFRQIAGLLVDRFDQSILDRCNSGIVRWQLSLASRSWSRVRQRLLSSGRYPMAWNGPGNFLFINTETLYWAVYALYELSGKVHPSIHRTFFHSSESFSTFRSVALFDYNLILVLLLEVFFGHPLDKQSTVDIASKIEQALDQYGLTSMVSQSSGTSHGRRALHNSNSSSSRNSSNVTASSTGVTAPGTHHANIIDISTDTDPESSPSPGSGSGSGNVEPSPGAGLLSEASSPRQTADKIFTLYSLTQSIKPTTSPVLSERLDQHRVMMCQKTDWVMTTEDLKSDARAAAAVRRHLLIPTFCDPKLIWELLNVNRILLSRYLDQLDRLYGRPSPKHDIDAVTVTMDAILVANPLNSRPRSFSRTTVEELRCFGGTPALASVCVALIRMMSKVNPDDHTMQSLVDKLRDRVKGLVQDSGQVGTHMGDDGKGT